MAESIDLNADVGEGVGDDAALIPLVTSVNVACGGHAGDAETIEAAVTAAQRVGATIGAHPGHEDRENFGRALRPIAPAEAGELVVRQVARLQAIAARCGAEVRYVKLHGALYHQAARDAAIAAAVAEAARPLDLLGPPAGALREQAIAREVRYHAEAFADRAYAADGSLVPRSATGAVLSDRGAVVRQAVSIATRGGTRSASGEWIAVRADSLCLHGDSPGALGLAGAVRSALAAEGLAIKAFIALR